MDAMHDSVFDTIENLVSQDLSHGRQQSDPLFGSVPVQWID